MSKNNWYVKISKVSQGEPKETHEVAEFLSFDEAVSGLMAARVECQRLNQRAWGTNTRYFVEDMYHACE